MWWLCYSTSEERYFVKNDRNRSIYTNFWDLPIENQKKQKFKYVMKSFKLLFGIFAFICFVFIFFSCKKEEYSQDSEIYNSSVAYHFNTKSSSNIAAGVYNIYPKYKVAYVHYQQGSTGCGQLNYLLCLRAITRGDNSSSTYASNITTKLNDIINYTGISASVSDLMSYFNTYDYNLGYNVGLFSKSKSSTNAQDALVEAMLYYLDDQHKPFIFLGAIQSGNSWVGHYYTVWNITWTKNFSTSLVYYMDTTDPVTNDFDTQIKSTTLSTFLSWAYNNPLANNYNFIYFYWI